MKYYTDIEKGAPQKKNLVLIDNVISLIDADDTVLKEWALNYAHNHRLRIAFDIDLTLQHIPQGSKILDVGSIPPLLIAVLKNYDYDVQGLDISPERFQGMIKQIGLEVVKCDIETKNIPFADNSFDGVIFNEMFEHLRINPIFTLREILRVIKPEGTLLLSTPNLKSIRGFINYIFRNRAYSCAGNIFSEYQKLNTIGHMGHVREYTAKEVCEFLEKVGFCVKKVIYRGQWSIKGYKSRVLMQLISSFAPFMTIVAKKYKDKN